MWFTINIVAILVIWTNLLDLFYKSWYIVYSISVPWYVLIKCQTFCETFFLKYDF